MKRNLLLILILVFAVPAFAAGDWHDDLITNMNSENAVERTLAVDRDPSSGKIRQATYRYTFKQKSLYKSLRAKLLNRENEASNFILRPGDDGQIIMKFVKPDNYRNYSLSHVNGKYQLIISVNKSDPYDYAESESQRQYEQRQKQLEERQRQFAQQQAERQRQLAQQQAERQRQQAERQRQLAQQQAERQRQQAERQKQLAQQQAERQRQQAELQRQLAQQQAERQRQLAEQQAELARQQAERARQQAERMRQQAERAKQQAEKARQQAERTRQQIKKSNSASHTVTISEGNSVESQNISSQLKAAEAERKRLLNN